MGLKIKVTTKLLEYIVNHGYEIPHLNIAVGFHSRNSIRYVLHHQKEMPLDRWILLADELKLTLDETIKLHKERI